ncbi:MAG: AraC family transcriptional regulator [Clostridiales bacterium]|nr:AraC family transcriptional regulator [Clostridiales bacterium]
MIKNKINLPPSDNIEIEYYVRDSEPDPDRQLYYPVHVHDYIEFYYLIDGDVSFMVDNTTYPLKPGDAVFCRPNEIHHCIRHSERPHLNACFWFMSGNDFLLAPFLRDRGAGGNLLSPSSDETRAAIRDLVIKLGRTGEKDTLLEFSQLIQLLDIWRGCLSPDTVSGELPEQLKLILDDISKNLPEIRSISYLTDKYYLSPSQLRRLFATHLGTTPKAYIEGKRLARSRILLKSGARVTEACMASGFPDLSNYIRLFRTNFGITPSEYRKGIISTEPNKYK